MAKSKAQTLFDQLEISLISNTGPNVSQIVIWHWFNYALEFLWKFVMHVLSSYKL